MQRIITQPVDVAPPSSDYAHACEVESERLLIVSGQVALDADGSLVGRGDFEAQVRQVFQNIEAVLRAAHAEFANVMRFKTYLTHYGHVRNFAQLRHELFVQFYPDGAYPAHTLLVVSSLAYPEYLIEVEAMADLER